MCCKTLGTHCICFYSVTFPGLSLGARWNKELTLPEEVDSGINTFHTL